MELQDKTIKCTTCGREFLYTVKEQDFFATKGFKEPRHCRECRQQRKHDQVHGLEQAVGAPQPVMRGGKEMFRVICGNCQRETFVPFKPITGKPVLCKDCFIAQRFGHAESPKPEAAPTTGETPGNSTASAPDSAPRSDAKRAAGHGRPPKTPAAESTLKLPEPEAPGSASECSVQEPPAADGSLSIAAREGD